MKPTARLALIPAILLSACAPPKPAMQEALNEVMPVQARKAQTAKVSTWELRGAMAANYQNKGFSASLNWLQKGPTNYQLRLLGPLGSGAVTISRQGSVVTYQDGPKKVTSTHAAKLLQQQTGIRLPVNHLYYWVRGLAAPGAVQGKSFDAYNHLTQLQQAGYTINYTRYTAVNGVDLPSKIRLSGHGVSIKLVIKSWQT